MIIASTSQPRHLRRSLTKLDSKKFSSLLFYDICSFYGIKIYFYFPSECIFNGDDVLEHVFMSRLRLTGSQTCSFQNGRFIRRQKRTRFLRRLAHVSSDLTSFFDGFRRIFFNLCRLLWEVLLQILFDL